MTGLIVLRPAAISGIVARLASSMSRRGMGYGLESRLSRQGVAA
jgi:hypothetical protein